MTLTCHHREHREKMGKDPFTGKVIGCAIEVHRVVVPGCSNHHMSSAVPGNFIVERLKDGLEAPRNKVRGISDCQGKCLFLFARFPRRKQQGMRSLFNSKV